MWKIQYWISFIKILCLGQCQLFAFWCRYLILWSTNLFWGYKQRLITHHKVHWWMPSLIFCQSYHCLRRGLRKLLRRKRKDLTKSITCFFCIIILFKIYIWKWKYDWEWVTVRATVCVVFQRNRLNGCSNSAFIQNLIQDCEIIEVCNSL